MNLVSFAGGKIVFKRLLRYKILRCFRSAAISLIWLIRLFLIFRLSSHADLQIYKNSRLFPFDSSDNRRQKSPLVLIADQDDNQRRMLDAMLDLWNIEVLEAENGEETIDLTVRARSEFDFDKYRSAAPRRF